MECKPNSSESNRAASPYGLAAKRSAWRLLSDKRAASIVEFALVTPIFLLLLGGAIDFGVLVRTKMQLSSSVSAAANYAINNATLVESTDAPTLAQNLATLMASSNGTNSDGTSWANSSATVNFGPSVTINAGTTTPISGTAGAASNFYCPTSSTSPGTGTSTSLSCGANGLFGGKYVVLSASRNYKPMILPIRLFNLPQVTSGTPPVTSLVISASSVVQVQ
jgi:Flp pilus assembly protein TadG